MYIIIYLSFTWQQDGCHIMATAQSYSINNYVFNNKEAKSQTP